ncbi:MAG: AraC family transcriptional regulator [Hellea sp.]
MTATSKTKAHAVLVNVEFLELINMFDLIPNTLFWIKDVDSRFLHVNQTFIDFSGMRCISKIIGKNDFSISPPYIAEQFIQDDKKVMQGATVTERIELNMHTTGELGWYSTSKRPLFDKYGMLIGTYGFTRLLEQSSKCISILETIRIPVEFIHKNFHETITIEKLAKLSFLSVSALERRFKKHMGQTPKNYISEVRLDNARRLLIENKRPIIEIANQCGFSEHSYFSKQFKKMYGISPSTLREQVQTGQFMLN